MTKRLLGWVSLFGTMVLAGFTELGEMTLFLGRTFKAAARRPYRVELFLLQAEMIGFGSLFIVGLTGFFTGAVFTLQTVNALEKVGMESMVGSTVLLAVSRELAPVLAALMVSGRVGSAMATELGNMRVTEQIDAIEVMAIDPLGYLIVPRVLACLVMMPCLCVVFDLVAYLGAWIVAIPFLGIDEGSFSARIAYYVIPSDFLQGLLKAAVFGLIVATIGCYKGFFARGGARGVGLATTQSVVSASVAIFIADYLLTAVLLQILPK